MEWNIWWNLTERGMETEWKEIKFLDGIGMEWKWNGMEWKWNNNGETRQISVTLTEFINVQAYVFS